MGLMAFGAMFPGFLGLFLNLSRSRPRTTLAREKRQAANRQQSEHYHEGARFALHQMCTSNDRLE